jgi:hypothetical protein
MPTTWYNNVGIDCKGKGLNSNRNSSQPVPNPYVYNNTFVNAPQNGVDVGVNDPLTDCLVANNIMANTGSNSMSNCTSRDNQTGSVASFNFNNPGNDDYSLTASSSAAIDQATTSVNGQPTTDHLDKQRSADPKDAGAYEYVP